MCGPGISCGARNIYKLHDVYFFVFEVWNLDTNTQLNFTEMVSFCKTWGLMTVPVLDDCYYFPQTVEELITLSSGKSVIGDCDLREGIIVRDFDTYRESFKVRDPKYLDKNAKDKQKALEAKVEVEVLEA